VKIRLGLIGMFVVTYSLSAQDTTRISLLFIGDVMQHDSQIKAAYNTSANAYDYSSCFRFVKPYLASADLAIGNLEVTLAGSPYKGYPQFSAPDELALTLKDCGMDILVTANNHCLDRGKKGLERTITMLDSLDVMHTGTFRDTVERLNDYPLLVEKNGFRLALLNYTYGTNGIPVTKPNVVNSIDTTIIRNDINKAKELSPDAIIVFLHWGQEYQSLPNKWQRDIAGVCFTAGAKLVIGAHPHVLQPMEWRQERDQLIAYSLGNFVSGQRDRYKNGGAMLKVDLVKTGADSLSTTRIDSAGYILEWVYRTTDARKQYYVLPGPEFEQDTTGFIKDDASKLAFKLFMDDSRRLFRKHNVSLNEIKSTANMGDALKPEEE
jgi:poly-gamma-glutamate capsule biosynthesis protein CapA/YwtB (metallophosphatase superfamily)